MSEQEKAKTIYTLLLADGSQKQHVYEIPSDRNEAWRVSDQTIEMIAGAMSGDIPVLTFLNPCVWYNRNYVLSVEIEATEDALESLIRPLAEKHGAHKLVRRIARV